MAIALSVVLDSKLNEIGAGQGAAKSLTDADIQALAALAGGLLVPALDMIDHSDVVRVETPHGHALYQVHGTNATHDVLIGSPGFPSACSCPAFVQTSILLREAVVCKHLLAARIADRLGRSSVRPASYDFLASMSNNFADPQ